MPAPIQAVDRALTMLRAIADAQSPPTTAELAAATGVNRSTAWRLLATLEAHELVQRDASSGRYQVAYGSVRLASLSRPQIIARRVRSTLDWLAKRTSESVQLTVPDGGGLRVVDEIVSSEVLTVRWRGHLLPVETSSVGKLLLAWLPAGELESLLGRPIEPRTARSMTSADDLRRSVARARETGIGTSLGEHDIDVNGFSSAVVDRGTPIAFLSVSGPASRLPDSRLPELTPILLEAAARAGRQLGVRP